MKIGISIPTKPEYWGSATTDEEALRASQALQAVLIEAARRLGIDAEIGLSGDGNTPADDICETAAERALLQLNDRIWDHDKIQAAAYESEPIDVAQVLRDYNTSCRERGGEGYPEFD